MFGLFSSSRSTDKTDHEIYLERELETMREADERRSRQEEENREQRQKEREVRRDEEARSADSWPDAFQKESALCRREVRRGLKLDKQYGLTPEPDDFFSEMAAANDAAFEIWKSVAIAKADDFLKLQEALDAFWVDVRNQVADQLISKNDKWKGTAESIRDDQLEGYLDW